MKVHVNDQDLLSLGLTALANSGNEDWLSGHWGASAISAHYILNDSIAQKHAISSAVRRCIENLVARKASFFRPLPKEQPNPRLLHWVADALDHNVDDLKRTGHNIIYASLAIKALTDRPEMCTHAVVSGICKLTHLFDQEGEGPPDWESRKQKLNFTMPDEPDIPDFACTATYISFTYDEYLKRPDGHLLTMLNSAIELRELGYEELGKRALASHRYKLPIWRRINKPQIPSSRQFASNTLSQNPLCAIDFWKANAFNWQLGHLFKYTHAYFSLSKRLGSVAVSHLVEKQLAEELSQVDEEADL